MQTQKNTKNSVKKSRSAQKKPRQILVFYEVVMEKREDDAYLITGIKNCVIPHSLAFLSALDARISALISSSDISGRPYGGANMAEQVLNQFRSDKELREDCVAIYESLGMDLNTAFRMFMERTRMVRGLPFPAVLPETRMWDFLKKCLRHFNSTAPHS